MLIVPLLSLLVSTAPGPVELTGTVDRGEDFVMTVRPGLQFRLDFIDYGPEGWVIRILDPADPDDNFCSVVTPPYRGVNALQIYAWHFFNSDMTGPADGWQNAPGEERNFLFVKNREDFQMAFDCLSRMLWPQSPEDADIASAQHDAVEKYRGTLTVTGLETGSIPEADSVWIDRMDFSVVLFAEGE